MSKKIYVLDTNVLVVDPQAIFKFQDNDVVIPLVALEEIDSFKREQSSRAQAARQVSRILDDLRESGSLHIGVELEGGGMLRVQSEWDHIFGDNNQMNNDKIILGAVKYLHKFALEENVILVTKDINLRVRADAIGITAQDYRNMKVKSEELYEEVHNIDIQDWQIDHMYQHGAIEASDLDWFKQNETPHENQYFTIRSYGGKSALGCYRKGVLFVLQSHSAYGLSPKNKDQVFAMDALLDPEIELVALVGRAGTGKSLSALACGLEQVVNQSRYNKLTVTRPVVPMGRDIGFLPGDLKEKMMPWLGPIYDNFEFLSREAVVKMRGKAGFDYLEEMGYVGIEALTYIRGRSIPDQFIIVEEVQNATPHEIKTILTRAGKGTKIVLTGDPYQIDSPYLDMYSNGLSYVIDKMKGCDNFAYVNFTKGERSKLAELAADLL
jgi:PhoH-like ATPase